MGVAGFRELLSCALPRATLEIPWLAAVQVNDDGSLAAPAELKVKHKPDELSAGGVILVAQLLSLLVAFIGEGLTVHLVREIWPHVPLDDLDPNRRKHS